MTVLMARRGSLGDQTHTCSLQTLITKVRVFKTRGKLRLKSELFDF